MDALLAGLVAERCLFRGPNREGENQRLLLLAPRSNKLWPRRPAVPRRPLGKVGKAWLLSALLLGASAPAVAAATAASARVPARESGEFPGWWSQAQGDLVAREYQASSSERGLQAPNRAHGFRTYFTADGIRVVAREGSDTPELLRLRLAGIGRGRTLTRVAAGTVSHREQRVEIARPGLTEWYENSAAGLEQGFVVTGRPPGRGALRLELEVSGAVASGHGDAVEFASASGQRLRYGKLAVWDADGRSLAARMEGAGSVVALQVEDARAAYPLTIEPLLSTVADSQMESNQVGALFGYSVASAGDVNGDGYADVLVGAYAFDGGENNEGAAFLYHGSANGLAAAFHSRLEANQADAFLGYSVAGAGDVNGDGYADVIVGAYSFDDGQVDEGVALVYLGGAGGLSGTFGTKLQANQVDASFGASVAGAGDVNGDGYADVLVGAPLFDSGQAEEGVAFIYHGGANGVSTTFTTRLEANQAEAALGASVAGAGDVNRDGYGDVIVGAYAFDGGQLDEGVSFVYHGGPGGVASTFAARLECNRAGAYLGTSVAAAGDVNGDGYADVIVGAHGFDAGETDEGAALVYLGSASGVSSTAAAQLEGNQVGAFAGSSVASAGDVNGDGYADVLVGAYAFDDGQTDEGAAFLYRGGAGGVSGVLIHVIKGNQAGAYLGISVAGAGDVNGDGYADVLAGAHGFDNGQTDEGGVIVFHGFARVEGLAGRLELNVAGDHLGSSVAGAGDVNGDGYDDVIVGAPHFDNGQVDEGAAFVFHGGAAGLDPTYVTRLEPNQDGAAFGGSVAGAGDVNGDGYADVIVGAYLFDGGETDEGAAFVFHGSAAGVNAMVAVRLEIDGPGAALGGSVAGAGDVNGDGYSDVVVGAHLLNTGYSGAGAAFVYLGSARGVSDTFATWLGSHSDQSNAYLGVSVAGAGDVNGDGYADVLVGASGLDNGQVDEGAALVFHGGPFGTSATPSTQIEANQAGAHLGASVAAAGDVNGDGYADILVGAPELDDGLGAALAYHGSAGGLSSVATKLLPGMAAFSKFGASVAGVGDVNGDGYADVAVGAYFFDAQKGMVLMHYGSELGLGWATNVQRCLPPGTLCGFSVAGAGDVNGDGFADVILGMPGFGNGQADEGAVFVYHGGGGSGRPVRARQFRPGSSVPVAPWGSSRSLDSVELRLFATHPAGGGSVKLEIESCLAGRPFGESNGCRVYRSASWLNLTGTAGQTIVGTIPGLTAARLYRWRARLLYGPAALAVPGIVPPPKSPHGPWRRPRAQANEADFRTQDGVFYTLAPCRVVDTRGGAPIGGPILTTGSERTLPLVGKCQIPTTARAVSLNITAVLPTGPGALTFYPVTRAATNTTAVSFPAGSTRANNAVLGLNSAGQLQVLPSVANPAGADEVHLVVDVNGYFE
jgi:FG-GAP repeat/FG-GAP-like repeat